MKRLVGKVRFSKNYKFALHGYCSGRLAVADLGAGNVYANAAGKPLISFIKKKMEMICKAI